MAEETEEEVPAVAGPRRMPRPTPRDLKLIREWRPEEPAERVAAANLTAALAFLPEAEHKAAEKEIRQALRFYLGRRGLERRPDPTVRAAQWRTIQSAARTLRRALLAHSDPPRSSPIPEVLIGDVERASPWWLRDDHDALARLAENLARLEETALKAKNAAKADAATEARTRRGPRDGPTPDFPMTKLLEELRPRWEPLRGGAQRGFVIAVMEAIGETWSEPAVRNRQHRLLTATTRLRHKKNGDMKV